MRTFYGARVNKPDANKKSLEVFKISEGLHILKCMAL